LTKIFKYYYTTTSSKSQEKTKKNGVREKNFFVSSRKRRKRTRGRKIPRRAKEWKTGLVSVNVNIKTKNEVPLIVVLSKIDLIRYEEVLPILSILGQVAEIDEIVPISSLKNKNTTELVDCILKYLEPSPVKNFEYEEDYYTNKSLTFIASETIREKALYFLQEEIPHGIRVTIINFEEKKDIVIIDADIICEKDSHKSIVIGKQGSMLKKIGEKARAEIERLVAKKVLLKLFVKTKKNWRENQNYLTEFGYKNEDL
jgi:GTP-binding protein Era